MAIRDICRMGNPVLRQIAKTLERDEILSAEFRELIVDMKDSMDHYGGIGIAAPQIGVSKQVCIIELDKDNERYEVEGEHPFRVFINPEITVLDKEESGFWEGCLSLPGLRGYVERPRKIKVKYLDEQAQEQEIESDDFLAVVLQHELDHLFGTLYIDRIKDTKLLSYDDEFDDYILPTVQESDET